MATEASRILHQAGLNLVSTVIGPADPLRAIEDMANMRDGLYDVIVISTLPLGLSRWLRRDLPSRVRSRFGIEVEHVVSRPGIREVA